MMTDIWNGILNLVGRIEENPEAYFIIAIWIIVSLIIARCRKKSFVLQLLKGFAVMCLLAWMWEVGEIALTVGVILFVIWPTVSAINYAKGG